MAEHDLDQYLSDLGISTEDEAASPAAAPESLRHEVQPEGPIREILDTQVQRVVGDSPVERCESFLVNLLLNLDPSFAADVYEVGDGLSAEISGGDAGKLIGRGGRTLMALEYLTSAVVNRDESQPHVRVSVDVGGYKSRRDDRLRSDALKACARVRKSGFAVELEPMSAAERRVIHMTVADEPGVESESSGEGKGRRVVIKPL